MTEPTTPDPADVAAEKIAGWTLANHKTMTWASTLAASHAIIRAAYAEQTDALNTLAGFAMAQPECPDVEVKSNIVDVISTILNARQSQLDAYAERDAAATSEIHAFRNWLDGLKKNPTTPDSPMLGLSCKILSQLADETDSALSRLSAPAAQPCPYGFDDKTGFFISELAYVAASSEPRVKRLAAIRELERRVREEGGES